jgi:hypothetical protein
MRCERSVWWDARAMRWGVRQADEAKARRGVYCVLETTHSAAWRATINEYITMKT